MYQCPQGHYYNFMVNNLGAGQSAVNVEAFKNQYIKLLIDEYYSNRSCTTFSVDQLTVNKSIREPWLITMPLEKGKWPPFIKMNYCPQKGPTMVTCC